MNNTLENITVDRKALVEKYHQCFEIYTKPEARELLAHAELALFSGNFNEAASYLKDFKSEDELLFILEEKLRGKPVYSTLKKIRKGMVESKAQILKGLFSLGVHAAIEIEHGADEYSYILKRIHEKIGRML